MLIRIKNDNNIKQMTQSLLEKLKPEVVEALENNKTDEMKQISVEILEAISNLENYDHLKFSNDEALPQEKELIDKK